MIQSELQYLIGAKNINLKCRVFDGKTGPFSTVRVLRVVRPVATDLFRVVAFLEPIREIGHVANTSWQCREIAIIVNPLRITAILGNPKSVDYRMSVMKSMVIPSQCWACGISGIVTPCRAQHGALILWNIVQPPMNFGIVPYTVCQLKSLDRCSAVPRALK
jgi:hypothetical protein